MNQAQPTLRLADFFEADAKLMNEVLASLRALQFTVIRQRRRSASKKLISDMSTSLCRRERIDEPNDPDRILEQPFFEIVARLAALFRCRAS